MYGVPCRKQEAVMEKDAEEIMSSGVGFEPAISACNCSSASLAIILLNLMGMEVLSGRLAGAFDI